MTTVDVRPASPRLFTHYLHRAGQAPRHGFGYVVHRDPSPGLFNVTLPELVAKAAEWNRLAVGGHSDWTISTAVHA